jgi:predicted metal-dependent phosphoesterase TrpH
MPTYFDLHIHTTAHSGCSNMTPDQMAMAAKDAGLDGVCITEHNRLWNRRDTEALGRKHGITILCGMEITTTGGDILAFGLEQEPRQMWTSEKADRSGKSGWPDIADRPQYPLTPAFLKSKVEAVGGLAIAAHPFRRFLVFGFGELPMNLEEAMSNPTFSHVHGLEVWNSMSTRQENDLALQVAEALGCVKFGGSDAHSTAAVGSCVTIFEDVITDERELVSALRSGRFKLERRK